VSMLAVEPDDVVPHREAGGLALDLAGGFDRAVHQAAEHRDLIAELLDGVIELLDRLLGSMHRDDRRRGHAVGEIAEILGRDDVVGAAGSPPSLAVADPRYPKAAGRVDDREVEPDLVEALVEEPRKHRGREVARVLRRMGPEGLL